MIDPYQTLGVTRTATQDEIKNAYRNLAKKYHPDLNPGKKEAEKKFKDINTAYELVGTPESRAKFDRGDAVGDFEQAERARRGPFYSDTQEPGGGRYTWSFDTGDTGGGNEGFSTDWIDEILRGRMRGAGAAHRGTPREPPPVQYSMEVSLADSVLGAQKEFQLPDGKRYSVKVPPGVKTGTKLKIPGGFIELNVRPDSRFRIEGSNLFIEVPVSLADAVLGGEITVPTLDGNARIKVPPHVNTGSKLKLAGKGLYDRQTRKRGDELVSLKVTLPSPPDPELDEAIRLWAKRAKPQSQEAA